MKNKFIGYFFKTHWYEYAVGLIFLIISSFIQTLSPKLLGKIIDILKMKDFQSDSIYKYVAFMVLVSTVTFGARYIWRYCIIGNGRYLESYLRQCLFEHFQKLSPEFYSTRKTGDLMAYAINDISAVRMSFGPGIALIFNGIGIGFFTVFSMVKYVNLKLALMALLPIPLIIFSMLKFGHLIQLRFKKVQETFARISDRVQENISGIRVIKAYVQEDMELDNFDKLNNEMKKSNMALVRVSSMLSPSIELCFGLSFMLTVIYGSSLVKTHVISLGDFVAFNGYLTMIIKPVTSIGRVMDIYQKGVASYKRLNNIFNEEPSIIQGLIPTKLDKISGSIQYENLTFTYPGAGEPALKDINLNIQPGQVIGVIGKTGSGKTTLVNILLKLYNVEPNMLYVDNQDINEFSLEAIRENIGYVPQDNFLFSTTIEENIKFFKDSYSEEDIENAAKLSLIYESIMEFPNKFDTIIGERGVNLSGGQKQRISIARALIKDPSILVLDDALSAVDTETEEQIIKNIKTVMNGRTGIIISHRISAIRHADQILVMEKGQILEQGTHEELLKDKKYYFELFMEQFNNEQERRSNYEAS